MPELICRHLLLKWDHGNSNDGKLKSVTYLYTGFSYHEPSLKSQEILRTECIQIFRHGILQTVGWNETLLRAWIAVLTAWQSADVLVRCVSTRGLGLFTFPLLQSCVWILNVSCLTVIVFFPHFLLVLISFFQVSFAGGFTVTELLLSTVNQQPNQWLINQNLLTELAKKT